ncbi:MAG: glycosyltransferase family 2 protein [bacterium]|nr:glycosyltransferase family 2 protein [bacterium]
MVKLSVIILSYNTKSITEQCVKSLLDSFTFDTFADYEIIIIDNNSRDGTVEMLQKLEKLQSKIKIVLNKENVGYPKGNNQGMKLAHGENVLFLNSDVLIEHVSFKRLLTYFESRKDVGILTVKVLLQNEYIDPASHRGFPTIWNSFCYFLKLEKIFGKVPVLNRLFGGYHIRYADLGTIHEIDSSSGAFLLSKKHILNQVKGFDEQFFMYGEDLDLSFRIKELGYKILYYPLYKVLHLKYSSGLKTSDNNTKNVTRNHFYNAMKIFYKKHYSHKNFNLVNKCIYRLIDLKKAIS